MSQIHPVIVPVSEARGFAVAALARAGLTAEEARQVADVLIEAELTGRPTHGLMRLPSLAKDCRSRKRRPITIVRETPASALLDGGNDLGYLVAAVRQRNKDFGGATEALLRHVASMGPTRDVVVATLRSGPWGGLAKPWSHSLVRLPTL